MAVELTTFLAEVIGRHYGPPEPRRGGHGRDWWICPFHDDHNPSLCVIPDSDRWKCFGCGATGDAVEFVRLLNPSMTFPEAKVAVGALDDPDYVSRAHAGVSTRAHTRKPSGPSPRPEGWQEFVQGIVGEAETNLWSDLGAKALRYLEGRGLKGETIQAARLGYWPEDTYREGIYEGRAVFVPKGVFLPWVEDGVIQAVQVRRPVGNPIPGRRKPPKYMMVRGSYRGIFPSRGVILPGRPLVLAEGEFDCLLLNQELAGLVPAITLGSASDRPDSRILLGMSKASPWYVAGDADGAGEVSSDDWLARSGRCRRIVPPAGDWTDAHRAGIDLRGWWENVLRPGDLLRTHSVNSGNPGNTQKPPFEAQNGGVEGPEPGNLLRAGGYLLRAEPLPGPSDPAFACWVNPESYQPGDAVPVVTPDPWRVTVARWPHPRWVAWRRLSGELQPAGPTAEQILVSERLAYLRIQGEPES